MHLTQEQVYQSTLKLLDARTPTETYQTVVSQACSLIGSEGGTIYLDYRGSFRQVFSNVSVPTPVIPRKNGYTSKAFHSKSPLFVKYEQVKKIHPQAGLIEGKTFVFIPLIYDKKPLGTLNLLTPLSDALLKANLNSIQMFGTVASIAIKNSLDNEELQQALKTREVFISMASHELRTPLTTVIAYAQLIERSIQQGKIPPVAWVKQLRRESQRQKDLIDELFAIQQVKNQSLKYRWKNADLKKVIQRAVDAFKVKNSQRSLNVTYPSGIEPMLIESDPDKLTQAFSNILNNAHKFAPKDTPIKVSLAENSENFHITVTDQGPGIPEEELPYIFELFYSGKHPKKKGMGLGLYLTHEIVKAHGGEIAVDTTVNQGTTFKIILPKHGVE